MNTERTIVIVDVQNGFITPASAHIPDRINQLLGKVDFRHRVFTRFHNPPGSQYEKLLHWTRFRTPPETEIVTELQGKPTLIIDKNIYSSLTKRFLDFLRTENIEEIYVAGIDTDICVLKTAVDLFEAGYRPIVLADCCMSHAGITVHKAALEILPRFIGRKQIVHDSAAHFGLPDFES